MGRGKVGRWTKEVGDEDINTIDTSTPTQVQVTGPVTRARARQLNYQVRSLLGLCPTYLDRGNTCTHMDSDSDVLVLSRKLIKSTFKWIQPHVHTLSESST